MPQSSRRFACRIKRETVIHYCVRIMNPPQESERWSGCLEDVREQLLAMVKLEREVSHLKSAMEHVEAVALAVQESESPEVCCYCPVVLCALCY